MRWAIVWADDTTSTVIGILGAMGVFVGAVSGAYVLVFKARSAARKDEIDGWQALVASHEAQGERREKNMQGLAAVLELQQRENVRCQRVAAQTKQCLYFLQDAYNRMHAAVTSLGGDPGERLQLPPIEELKEEGETGADFLARQIQQNAQVVREADKQIAQQKAALETPVNANPAGGK